MPADPLSVNRNHIDQMSTIISYIAIRIIGDDHSIILNIFRCVSKNIRISLDYNVAFGANPVYFSWIIPAPPTVPATWVACKPLGIAARLISRPVKSICALIRHHLLFPSQLLCPFKFLPPPGNDAFKTFALSITCCYN